MGLYARVSTLDQQTLPLQIRAMREYVAKRGWTIAAEIKEVGSGAAQRELRETLLTVARRREVDVVLVWRLDRWGRSVADWRTSVIYQAQSGFPLTNSVFGDTANAGTLLGENPIRANYTGAPLFGPGTRTAQMWFNTAAFAAPPAYTFGTLQWVPNTSGDSWLPQVGCDGRNRASVLWSLRRRTIGISTHALSIPRAFTTRICCNGGGSPGFRWASPVRMLRTLGLTPVPLSPSRASAAFALSSASDRLLRTLDGSIRMRLAGH